MPTPLSAREEVERPPHLAYRASVVSSDWSDVPARVARLAAHTNAARIVAARRHRWRLEPPLRPDEIDEIESQLAVELPAEYRDFLQAVSRGGAGPGLGLFPLRCIDGRWRWEGDEPDLSDLATLAQPFPHAAAFNPLDGLPAPPDADDFDSTEAFNEAETTGQRRYESVVSAPERPTGLLYLCHLGCGLRDAIVVTGDARGQMWADRTAEDAGFRPLLDDDGSRMGFARWYRRWLEATEAKVAAET